MKIEGLKEAVDKLESLDRKVQKSIVRKGLRAGAKIMLAAAKAGAPVRSGNLLSNLKIRGGGTSKGSTRVTVGVAAKGYKGGEKAWYADFVILGHHVGSAKLGDARAVVKPNPFLERAYEATASAVVEATAAYWADQIESAALGK